MFCVSIALDLDGRVSWASSTIPCWKTCLGPKKAGARSQNGRRSRLENADLSKCLLATVFPTTSAHPDINLNYFAAMIKRARPSAGLIAAHDLAYVAAAARRLLELSSIPGTRRGVLLWRRRADRDRSSRGSVSPGHEHICFKRRDPGAMFPCLTIPEINKKCLYKETVCNRQCVIRVMLRRDEKTVVIDTSDV